MQSECWTSVIWSTSSQLSCIKNCCGSKVWGQIGASQPSLNGTSRSSDCSVQYRSFTGAGSKWCAALWSLRDCLSRAPPTYRSPWMTHCPGCLWVICRGMPWTSSHLQSGSHEPQRSPRLRGKVGVILHRALKTAFNVMRWPAKALCDSFCRHTVDVEEKAHHDLMFGAAQLRFPSTVSLEHRFLERNDGVQLEG